MKNFIAKTITDMQSVCSIGSTVFSGFAGVLFAFLLPKISNQKLIFKGATYVIGIWFFAYTVTLFFKVPGLIKVPLETVFSNFIAAFIYSISLAITSSKLNKVGD